MDNLKSTAHWWVALAHLYELPSIDVDTFLRRVAGEGITFLTIQLPSLGKDVDRALITGEPLIITGRFGLKRGKRYPLFLQDLFERVFGDDGNIREECDPIHIRQIRQLAYLYYKMEVDYDEDTLESARRGFIVRDRELTKEISWKSPELRRARGLIAHVLAGLNPLHAQPRHGSGAVANRLPNHDKYHIVRFIPRLNAVFEYGDYFFYNHTHLADELDSFLDWEEIEEPHARLVSVPKDSRGPRLICCEPSEFQYVQQGLMSLLYDRVETHKMTAGYVNFTDQTINKRLARESSVHQDLATLDLKDASDRVRWDVVQHLFPREWVNAFDACRTRYVTVGKDTVGPLRKFAPMGSAVCFPVEALVFWALLKGKFNVDVWVYGDDIILPTKHAERAIAYLEELDLLVNKQKSCYRSPFRESCGGDFYKGHDVGYVKVRKVVDNTVASHIAQCQFVNELTQRYTPALTTKFREHCDQLYGPHLRALWEYPNGYVHDVVDGNEISIATPFTLISDTVTLNSVFFKKRYDVDLQQHELLVPTIVTKEHVSSSSSPWRELHRRYAQFGNSTDDPFGGPFEHYQAGCYAVPKHCFQKFRWSPIS
jgi:hypothetical protein